MKLTSSEQWSDSLAIIQWDSIQKPLLQRSHSFCPAAINLAIMMWKKQAMKILSLTGQGKFIERHRMCFLRLTDNSCQHCHLNDDMFYSTLSLNSYQPSMFNDFKVNIWLIWQFILTVFIIICAQLRWAQVIAQQLIPGVLVNNHLQQRKYYCHYKYIPLTGCCLCNFNT